MQSIRARGYPMQSDISARRLEYATDTPAPDEPFYAALAADRPLDCVVVDHTYGPAAPDIPRSDHMSAHDVCRMVKTLRTRNLLKSNGAVYATHISHEGTPLHDELEQFGVAHGYHIAWDGLTLFL